MRKISEYTEAIRAALQRDVLGELSSEHARSQLLGAIDVLDKLEGLVEWSPEMLDEQIAALSAGSARLSAQTHGLPGPRPAGTDAVDPGSPEGRLGVEAGLVRDWVDWLYAHRAELDPETSRALERVIRDVIQATLAAERRRIQASNYSSMT
jgi:hypothetical protein